MTAPSDADAYAKFRADLAAENVPTDVAVIAYRFAHTDLTRLADEEEALIVANRVRVREILDRAITDAKSMTPADRECMMSMILADVTP